MMKAVVGRVQVLAFQVEEGATSPEMHVAYRI